MDKPTSDNHSDATPRPGRVRVDWDAIRRDHRTGKYTDGELAELHGVSREAIVRRRKREPDAWPQDLSQAVREATNAALVTQMVTEAITDGHKQITDSVLAAAEIGKQVILGHRQDAKRARASLEQALATVLAHGAAVTDIREAAVFASAVESLSRTAKNCLEIEAKAFQLYAADEPKTDRPSKRVMIDFIDVVAK